MPQKKKDGSRYDNFAVNVSKQDYDAMVHEKNTTGKSFPKQISEALKAKRILETVRKVPLLQITARHLFPESHV